MERTSRLQSFVDLGPADLCNIHKMSSQSKKVDCSTFLYYTGIDTSNSASIAAHLQALATLITARSQYWFGEKKHWKVPELTYCTYNAFSRVDMRVSVHIPGKFETQIVNNDGKLIQDKLSPENTERLWLETFMSSMVRCLLDADDDDVNKVGGLVEIRRENPFGNGKASKELLATFIDGFETLFYDGPKLGCDIDIPQPTLNSNYLVDGFLKCIALTQHFDAALDVLRRLEAAEPSVSTLIAKIYLMKDEEIKAVQIMHDAVKANPRDSEILLLEAEFLLEKKRYDLALHLAKQAVQSLPSDFKTWAMLVKVYTKLNDFENALLTLNSCPMNSQREAFSLKRIISLRNGTDDLHLPSPVDVTLDEVSNLQSGAMAVELKSIDQLLLNLPAANLKSTFAKAYDLLTDIVAKTGWEALLKYRAKVFVMEEEYRKERGGFARRDSKTGPVVPPKNGESSPVKTVVAVPDDASVTGIKSPSRDASNATNDEDMRKKRLCERWLDNLFMLLYEDLRVYTMWQAEFVHFQAQQIDYKKTTLEWEILGSVAFRLKHFKEGSVAYTNALRGRFSAKSQREVLSFYQKERFSAYSRTNAGEALKNVSQNYKKSINHLNEKILEGCIRLLVWNHRWYSDFSPPLMLIFADLLAGEGLIKLQSVIQAVYSGQFSNSEGATHHGIAEMMDTLFEFAREYQLQGVEN